MRPSHWALRQSHTPEAIADRFASGPKVSYLKDLIYGAIDGAITTFAIVAGVAGAGLSSGVLLVLGLANLLADGFSMAVSCYLGTKAEQQTMEKLRQVESEEIDLFPEGEREEIRQIYQAKGFEGELLEQVVTVITAQKSTWIDSMIQEEHGLSLNAQRPLLSGIYTFVAFVIAGSIPLLPFVLDYMFSIISSPFLVSGLLTAATFALVGWFKGRSLGEKGWASGLETLCIGACAAAIAYGVGAGLKLWINV